MLRLQIVLCLCLGLSSQCLASFGWGACPDVTVVQDFAVSNYTGLWYEVERHSVYYEWFGKCVTATYTAQNDSTVAVHNVEKYFGTTITIDGSAKLANSSSTEAKLEVTLPVPLFGDKTAPYWVLDTDYDNYSVVYACQNYLGKVFHFDFAWILSRDTTLSSDSSSLVDSAIEKAGLKRKSFSKTTQDC